MLGMAGILVWFVVFSAARGDSAFIDEAPHQDVIEGIVEGKWIIPEQIPMLPGYHWLMALANLAFGSSLYASRAFTLLLSLLGVWFYSNAAKRMYGRDARALPLLYAFLPILFHYTGMVYTDAASACFVVGGLWAHVSRRFWAAALMMALACLMRQTNVIWTAFFVAWRLLEIWEEWSAVPAEERESLYAHLRRSWLPHMIPYFTIIGGMGIYILLRGSVLSGDVKGNRPQFNIGVMYTLAFLALLLWFPIWLERLSSEWRAMFCALKSRPMRACALAVALAGGLSVLAVSFSNWHPWTQAPFFLSNRALEAMDHSLFVRVVGAVCLVGAAVLVFRFWKSRSNRRCLALLGLFTLVFAAVHPLADPRYLLLPFVFSDFLAGYSMRQQLQLAIWYFSICMVMGPLIASGAILW